MPEKPSKPNRWAIMLIGLVLGIGGGVGLVSMKNSPTTRSQRPDTLALIYKAPVLASIPAILTARDVGLRRMKRIFAVVLALVHCWRVNPIFHFFVMDLNVFWAKVDGRISTM